MFCVYVIQHNEIKEIYIGKTNNLKRRLNEHNSGQQLATKRKSGKWILIYAEAYRDKGDANDRELKLKQHGSNKRWLLDRIKNSLIES
jgi:putative endonuclease